MRSMRSAQRQVELRRLGNQLPVLGKANSLCEVSNMSCHVSVCNFVFVLNCDLVRVGPGIRSSGKIRLASRRCTTVPVAPPGGEQIVTPAFYSFSSALSRFFVR